MKENKEPSGRKKQIQIFLILFIVFIAFAIILTLTSNSKNKVTDETTINETTSSVANETTADDVTEVTGYLGENNTLIPAKVEAIKSNKVITVNRKGESVDVAFIGITVTEENSDAEMERLNELIPVGTQVYLLYDENTYNSEGQELCYVWLSNQVDIYKSSDIQKNMIQGILILDGLAEPQPEYPNSRYEREFELINM